MSGATGFGAMVSHIGNGALGTMQALSGVACSLEQVAATSTSTQNLAGDAMKQMCDTVMREMEEEARGT